GGSLMRTRAAVLVAAMAALVLWSRPPIGAQSPGKGDADAHLKAYDAHLKLAEASPYKAMSWSWIGPTNVGGRMTDIAVADKAGMRRVYAASCCGGLWKTDNLGRTWEPIFD